MVRVTISRTDMPLLLMSTAPRRSKGFEQLADEEPAQGQRAAWRHGGRQGPWSYAGEPAR